MTMAGAAARLQDVDEMLEKQERRFPGLDQEILLHLRPLLAAERRVGEDHSKRSFPGCR